MPGQQTYLSKEYIHLGARTIAVENYLNLNTQTAVNVTQSNPWFVMASADLNRDGVPDLVWQQYPSSGWVQVWFLGGPNGTVLSSATNIATTPHKVVAAADFNRDGTPDLLLQDPATGKVYVWYLQVAGNHPTVSIQSTAVAATNAWNVLAAADFNGDGHPPPRRSPRVRRCMSQPPRISMEMAFPIWRCRIHRLACCKCGS